MQKKNYYILFYIILLDQNFVRSYPLKLTLSNVYFFLAEHKIAQCHVRLGNYTLAKAALKSCLLALGNYIHLYTNSKHEKQAKSW